MKKVLALLLSLVLICCVFVACSSDKNKTDEQDVSVVSGIPTDEAKIKDSEAIDFIKNAYTKEELGLDKVEENYSLMIANSAEEIDGVKYIKIAANVMSKNDETSENGKGTYSLNTVGAYYISFDGETVMTKDLATGEYKKLENKYKTYKQQSNTTAAETEKAE